MSGSSKALNALAPVFIPSGAIHSVPEVRKKADYFSPLPPELLDIIFDFVHSVSPLSRPISSSLAPFWKARHFKRVEIKSYQQLRRFATGVSTETLAYIHEFSITLSPYTQGFSSALDRVDNEKPLKEMKIPGWLTEASITPLFRDLSNVESLCISGSSRLARLVLSSEVALTSFPKLLALSLKSSFEGIPDPFHLAHLSSLRFHSEIVAFEFVVFRTSSTIRPSAKRISGEHLYLTPLVSLHLRGPLSASPWAKVLAITLRASTSLTLDDSSDSPELDHLLEVPFFGLEDLVVSGRPRVPLKVESLARFTRLRSLALFGSLSSTSTSFYDTLSNLPLTNIQFGGGGNELSTDGLISLVSGPKKISTLEVLILDKVLYGITDGGREFESPAYTPDFTPGGLERLVQLGQVEGVLVGGKAVAAMELDSEVEEELQMYRMANFLRSLGGFSLLGSVALFGGQGGRGRGGSRGGGRGGRGRGNGRGGGGGGRGGRGRRNNQAF